ncbi:hypothetical protein L1987_18492 [Smallanthus sonchifolius]|uniref:Uncharacterized protein n=1 Tax=Smallanthus sonchifolius TaxID=185202 RepID=A0ACB9J1W6_9ASTR|nr:hypothetical protein L1987_18492 [Smallanthus sonchifolius]
MIGSGFIWKLTSKIDIKELREKLKLELDQVRSLVQKLEDKEAEITHYSNLLCTTNNYESYTQLEYAAKVTIDMRLLLRINSEMGADYIDRIGLDSVGEFVEKEKRTPKANQYYRNSDFLLGKDRLPLESNKKLKSNGGRKSEYTTNLESHKNHVFRSCSNLL